MTISGLCADMQIASGNSNYWSISSSITQSFALCKIPDLHFLDDVLRCSPSLTKVTILSLHTFLLSWLGLSWPASHAQSPSILQMCISHFVTPFDKLLIYGQRLLFLFCRQHTQYHLLTPNCNFPVFTCIQFWDVVSNWLIIWLLEL